MLVKFQSSKWPVYETEVYLPEAGKAVQKTTVSQLIWPNELVSTTESNVEGARICRTVLSETEDHHRRQCEAAGHKTLSLNTLDASGRIIATVFDPGRRRADANRSNMNIMVTTKSFTILWLEKRNL
jgi:hypothetical protein